MKHKQNIHTPKWRRSYLLLMMGALFVTACQQTATEEEGRYNGWPNYFLKGKVRSIHSSFYGTDSAGNISWKWNTGEEWRTFDDQGNLLIELIAITGEEPNAKTEYTYKDGKLQESSYYFVDKLKERTIFEYHDASVAKVMKYDGEGDLLFTLLYEYNKDKITAIKEYSVDEKLISHTTYHYKGNILTDKLTELPYSNVFKKEVYDKKGWTVVKVEGGEIQDGKLKTTESTSYEYIYDEVGNWIQYTASENGEAQFIRKRTIEYF